MGDIGKVINRSELPTPDDFSPVPAGKYQHTVKKAEVLPTNSGGSRLNLQLSIDGPTQSGRVLFHSINLSMPGASEQAQEIAAKQLNAAMTVYGIEQLSDSSQFVGKRGVARVTIKNDPQYGAKNEVKGLETASGGGAPAPVQSAPAEKPPWAQ